MQKAMLNENIIIKEPSKNLRALGRNALAEKWKIAIITMCALFLIQSVPPTIFDGIFGTNMLSVFTNNGITFGLEADMYARLTNSLPHYCFLSAVYIVLVAGALQFGLSIFALGVFRGADIHVSDILLGFEKFGKALGLCLFQTLFISLWTMLLVVPGIIAAIRYSQAFFILADDSSKGIRQCMNESKAMMRGNKTKYFCLGLSFIGWSLLSSIPSSIVSNIGLIISNNIYIISLFAITGSLFMAPVVAYIYSTFAGFYEILAGHLIKETIPVPVTAEEAQKAYVQSNSSEGADAAEEEAKQGSEEVNTAGGKKRHEEDKPKGNDEETKGERDEQQ